MNVTEHLLVCLMEEASEIQKACAKALRFGLDDTYRPDNGLDLPEWTLTPRQELQHELNDLRGVVALLRNRAVLPELTAHDDEEESAKVAKVERLMGYARAERTLT